jgi:hypothetical protein
MKALPILTLSSGLAEDAGVTATGGRGNAGIDLQGYNSQIDP